jgi:hypothetical protein
VSTTLLTEDTFTQTFENPQTHTAGPKLVLAVQRAKPDVDLDRIAAEGLDATSGNT